MLVILSWICWSMCYWCTERFHWTAMCWCLCGCFFSLQTEKQHHWWFKIKWNLHPSIFYTCFCFQGQGSLQHLPACTGWEVTGLIICNMEPRTKRHHVNAYYSALTDCHVLSSRCNRSSSFEMDFVALFWFVLPSINWADDDRLGKKQK